MNLLSRRSLLAMAAVTDIALHARPTPVSARVLAERHSLPVRHLEPVLQALVRQGVLKGVRGPRGGYELARERRRVTAGEIVRIAMMVQEDKLPSPIPKSKLADAVIHPLVVEAGKAFLAALDSVTVEDLCHQAVSAGAIEPTTSGDFTI